MLFFIVGVNSRRKSLGGCRCVCPVCGGSADLRVIKHYSVFTFFFIPIIPFGGSYCVICPNCAGVMNLSKENGRAFERNPGIVISPGDLHITQNRGGRVCPSCGAQIITNQNFCYHCGARL